MALWDPVTEKLAVLRTLTPAALRRTANQTLSELILKEIPKSRDRIAALEKSYPSATVKEKGQRLMDGKKAIAGVVGGVGGVFGVLSVPADLVALAYLQLVLLVDVATLYKVNLKTEHSRAELIDLFGQINGIGALERSGPKLLGKVAQLFLQKGGWSLVGRVVPVVAAPISAYLNNQHIQEVGDEALRYYEGLSKVEQKRKK